MSDQTKWLFNQIASTIVTNGANITPELKLNMIIEKMNLCAGVLGINSSITKENN